MKRIKTFILSIALVFFPFFPAYSSEPSPEPILKIDTGMHTAPITRIAVDRQERFLVTGSLDKTVKLWDIPSGRLINTIRPPIGEGDEGKIYAVAISPDASHIAAGGWTGPEWDKSTSIYIFDRAKGRLISRIKGLPEAIPHLAYSADGRYLVACLGGVNGIRVYHTHPSGSYIPAFEDRAYGDSSYWAGFSLSGGLVVSSWDGYIRLYDEKFRLIHKKKTVGGREPFGVGFSPDGKRVVVGFTDTKNVDLYSGDDLSYISSLNTKDIDKGDFSKVSFSHDGRFILAGGTARKSIGNEPMFIIRKWDVANINTYHDIPVAKNTIMGIAPLRSGGGFYLPQVSLLLV